MSNITPIGVAAERRRRRRHDVMEEMAAMHPSLRWQAGSVEVAHRRAVGGRPACGADGVLRLAEADAPLCADCYPRAG